MDIVVGIIVGLLVLMALVSLHELGHFVAARRNGVRVLEYGIGFPPRAVAWIKDPRTHKWRRLKKSEWDDPRITKTVLSKVEKSAKNSPELVKQTKALAGGTTKTQTSAPHDKGQFLADGLIFSLNWLPIGGFCQMDGESAIDRREGTFGQASFWKKTKILFAGVAMNWLVAFVVLTILAWTGMPTFLDHQFTVASDTRTTAAPVEVVEVLEGSPAEAAGFQVGDKILRVGDETVSLGSDINAYNATHAGETVTYTILRETVGLCCDCPQCDCEPDGCDEVAEQESTITAQLNEAGGEYLLGIAMQSSQALSYSTWSAPLVGAGVTLQITGETFKGVGDLIWNLVTGVGRSFSPDAEVRESGQEAIEAVGDSVSGPVGIIGVLFPSFTAAGPTNLAFLAALISISLACMNVLPIPALDGGRWLLIALFKLRRKQLTPEIEQKIVARSMYILLALMAIVTILDITRFF